MNKLVEKIDQMKKRDWKMMSKVMNADVGKGKLVFEDYDVDSSSFLKQGGNSNSNSSNGSWTDEVMKGEESASESKPIVDDKDLSRSYELDWSI